MRFRVSARVAVLVAGALAVAGCGGGSPEATSEATPEAEVPETRVGRDGPFTVQMADLGMHSFTTKPVAASGSIRMNCSPSWRDTNPKKGVYEWEDFDFLLERAESWGYQDIMYVFCGTPDWAAGKASRPDHPVSKGKSTRPPDQMADWVQYVRQVAQRYEGRITAYQVWNEASSPQFFSGSAEEMAEMTELAQETVQDVDPDAVLVAASTQTHRANYYDGFYPDYLAALAKRNWPLDVFSLHGYPPAGSGPTERVEQLQMVQDDLAAAGAPRDRPLWDTEVNYELGSGGAEDDGAEDGRIKGDKAAAWTAITYLDSWRMGVRRSYWYLWTDQYYDFPGIQMREGDPSTAALNTLASWVVGKRFLGCETDGSVESCRFGDGSKGEEPSFRIAWTRKGEAEMPTTQEVEVCPVTGDECETESGEVRVSTLPVMIS